MLARELRTPPELAYRWLPDTAAATAGPDHSRQLQNRLEVAHSFAQQQMELAGIRQKRGYNAHIKGQDIQAGDLV